MRPRPIVVPMLLALTLAVTDRGDDLPGRAVDVVSDAEGVRSVVYIAPEGSRMTKGQVVCVLDAAPGGDRRSELAKAEADYRRARQGREVAEAAVRRYEEGTYKESLGTVEGELAMARAELKRAEDRYEWSRRMAVKGRVSEAQKKADEFGLLKAKFTLEQAETSKDVLTKSTKPKTIRELREKAMKALEEDVAGKRALDALQSQVKAAERRARARVILAPIDGTVRPADPARPVEVGAEVGEDRPVLRIVPPGG